MRYVLAELEKEQRTEAYRIYITDSMYYKAQNKYITVRYYDLLQPKELDDRTGDEIAQDVINRLGLIVGVD